MWGFWSGNVVGQIVPHPLCCLVVDRQVIELVNPAEVHELEARGEVRVVEVHVLEVGLDGSELHIGGLGERVEVIGLGFSCLVACHVCISPVNVSREAAGAFPAATEPSRRRAARLAPLQVVPNLHYHAQGEPKGVIVDVVSSHDVQPG